MSASSLLSGFVRRLARAVVLLSLGMFVAPVSAFDFCVDKSGDGLLNENTTGLLNALIVAELAGNDTSHTIRLVGGQYTIENYVFTPYRISLRMIGGYEPGCGSRENGSESVVSLNGQLRFVPEDHWGQSGLIIEHLTFVGGVIYLDDHSDSVNENCDPSADPVPVVFRRNRVLNGGVFSRNCFDRGVEVHSNLFISEMLDDPLLDITYLGEASPPRVGFNTFVFHCENYYEAAVTLDSRLAEATFHHNILTNYPESFCSDVGVDSGPSSEPWIFVRNIYDSLDDGSQVLTYPGHPGNIAGANNPYNNPFNLYVDFQDQEQNNDYHLHSSPPPLSLAIEAGVSDAEADQLGLDGLPSTDLDGNPRLIGERYDVGAYESPVSTDKFVVDKPFDDEMSVGTLRWAITQANAQDGLQSIEFNLPAGTCPAIITLADGLELPPITDDLVIDGYTQPCATINSSEQTFIGKPGIALFEQAGGPALDYGLRVESSTASLTVRGLVFTTPVAAVVAVDLPVGSGHNIFGNFFEGGVRGVRVATAGTVNIGGPDPWQRNVFGSFLAPLTTGRAILLNHPDATTTIENNLIGMTPAGNVARPIDVGVYVQAGDKVVIKNNVISSAEQAIVLSGAETAGVKIFANRLGTPANSSESPLASMANGVGILVANQSGGHRIGLGSLSAPANLITNSEGAGVALATSAGSGTRIARNTIYGNGASNGALSIDLGAVGQQQNDPEDADPGPNDLQNFPVITGSTSLGDGQWQVNGILSGAEVPHTIEIYRSSACPGGRSEMRTFVGQVWNVTPIDTNPPGGPPTATFSVQVPSTGGAPGFLTAVATQNGTGSTSETGPCFAEQPVDNAPPTITTPPIFTVLETAKIGDEIGTVEASDDHLPNDELFFSIIDGDPNQTFTIGPDSGKLVLYQEDVLDASVIPSYTLTIKVSDGALYDIEEVTVNVVTGELLCNGFEDAATPGACAVGIQ